MEKCEECSMRYLFGRQGEPWCTYFDVPLNGVGDNCRLTPAAMHLVEILIANGISDEDADLVEKAIAGEGRLRLEIEGDCPSCGGTGQRIMGGSVSTDSKPITWYETCSVCRGSGNVWQDQGGE